MEKIYLIVEIPENMAEDECREYTEQNPSVRQRWLEEDFEVEPIFFDRSQIGEWVAGHNVQLCTNKPQLHKACKTQGWKAAMVDVSDESWEDARDEEFDAYAMWEDE